MKADWVAFSGGVQWWVQWSSGGVQWWGPVVDPVVQWWGPVVGPLVGSSGGIQWWVQWWVQWSGRDDVCALLSAACHVFLNGAETVAD